MEISIQKAEGERVLGQKMRETHFDERRKVT
jgi:hypothetical protein